MFKFIKEHWIAYLIGAVIAIAIGFGASYFVGVIGSTPEDARAPEALNLLPRRPRSSSSGPVISASFAYGGEQDDRPRGRVPVRLRACYEGEHAPRPIGEGPPICAAGRRLLADLVGERGHIRPR